MSRKKWSAKTEITPALLKFREKRKWQIALRRYVLEQNPSPFYAPYFGLDIQSLRRWFETQFEPGTNWDDFAKKWQFEHVIPVTYFDFSVESELKLCWSFINLRVEVIPENSDKGNKIDVLAAKGYFEQLYKRTLYSPCLRMLEKIDQIELSALVGTKKQETFILENKEYLSILEHYTPYEFELLNQGKNTDDVKKEMAFQKKFEN